MLILASKSPRRRELLALYTENFIIEASDANEPEFSGGDVGEYVKNLARIKARSIAKHHPNDTVIGADTVVEFSGAVLGKPRDIAHAKEMLTAVSGGLQHVFTGVCIIKNGEEICDAVSTEVVFRQLSETEIDEYIATGECLDKAGAYGIQGGANEFVSAICGDYFNVVGLPMKRTCEILDSIKQKYSTF